MKKTKTILLIFFPLIAGCAIAYYLVLHRNNNVQPKTKELQHIENKKENLVSLHNIDSLFYNILLDSNSKTRKLIDSLMIKSINRNSKTNIKLKK